MMNGMITLILGTMFSGKSTELLKQLRRSVIAQKSTALMRPSLDHRPLLTHDMACLYHGVQEFKIEHYSMDDESIQKILACQTIGIDEWQFFPLEHWHDFLLPFLRFIQKHKKECYIASLSGTYFLQPFDIISHTIPLVNHISLQNAVCISCGQEAFYTSRRDEGLCDTSVGNVDNIGAIDKYDALCWDCWHEQHKEKDS
jgi:thymidine kinase